MVRTDFSGLLRIWGWATLITSIASSMGQLEKSIKKILMPWCSMNFALSIGFLPKNYSLKPPYKTSHIPKSTALQPVF
jgi:hypothetical protein